MSGSTESGETPVMVDCGSISLDPVGGKDPTSYKGRHSRGEARGGAGGEYDMDGAGGEARGGAGGGYDVVDPLDAIMALCEGGYDSIGGVDGLAARLAQAMEKITVIGGDLGEYSLGDDSSTSLAAKYLTRMESTGLYTNPDKAYAETAANLLAPIKAEKTVGISTKSKPGASKKKEEKKKEEGEKKEEEEEEEEEGEEEPTDDKDGCESGTGDDEHCDGKQHHKEQGDPCRTCGGCDQCRGVAACGGCDTCGGCPDCGGTTGGCDSCGGRGVTGGCDSCGGRGAAALLQADVPAAGLLAVVHDA